MTSLGCSIGIHLPKMCTSTKFPMFSFVRGSNPHACTNTWETRENHEKNVKFMKKTWNSWKKTWNSWKKNVKFMKKKREIHEKKTWNSWNSWKKTWNSRKKREIHEKTWNSWKKREIHEKKREIHEKHVKFMKKNVKFMKKTWNAWKKREIYKEKRENHERVWGGIHSAVFWICNIGVHLRENACDKREIVLSWKKVKFRKKREIHEENVKFLEKGGIHGKKREIHGKQREIHAKKRTIHEKNVKFMEKNCEIHGKQREIHEKKRTIHEKTWNSWRKREIPGKRGIHGEKRERHEQNVPHHMNCTELTPEPITVSSHPSIPLFPPPLPSSFPFLAGLVCRSLAGVTKANQEVIVSAAKDCQDLRSLKSWIE